MVDCNGRSLQHRTSKSVLKVVLIRSNMECGCNLPNATVRVGVDRSRETATIGERLKLLLSKEMGRAEIEPAP